MLAALRAELLVLRKWPAAWGQGTIGTALLAGAGRVRTGAAQAAALAIGLAASVLATFSVCAGSSLLIRALEANHVQGADGAMPASWVIARGLGVTLLIALAAGMLGLALGTVCRSAAGAIAAALIWTVIIQSNLYSLGTEAGGTLLRIVQFLPATSGVTLTGTFGALGGGAGTSVYLPMRPAVAVWTLAGYTAAFLGITLTLLYRRDVLTSRGRRPRGPQYRRSRKTARRARAGQMARRARAGQMARRTSTTRRRAATGSRPGGGRSECWPRCAPSCWSCASGRRYGPWSSHCRLTC